jgi:hypothetical protein
MDIKLKAPKSLISRLGHRLSGTVSSSPSWWSQNRESALASVTKVLQVTEKALDGIPAPGAKSVVGGVAEVLKTVQVRAVPSFAGCITTEHDDLVE